MPDNSKHEGNENVIGEGTSWEETLERLGPERKNTAGEDPEAGASGPPVDREGADEGGDDGGGISGGGEASRNEGEREQRHDGGAERNAGQTADGAAGGREETDDHIDHAAKKRIKRNRKELISLLEDQGRVIARLHERIESAKQELAAKSDRLLRMAAEFENYKKRTRREWELHQKRANAELIKDLLGVIDDLERALQASGETAEQFKHGVQLIHSGLLDVLKRSGLKEIEALNLAFDPQYHEAMGELESGEVAAGRVLQVVQKGYLLNDQLLRPAKVLVAKAKES